MSFHFFRGDVMPGNKKGKWSGRGCAPTTFVDENGRVCTKCGVYKTWDEFHNHTTNRPSKCKLCKRSEQKTAGRSANLKRKVVDHYGGFCACCGECEFIFLQIDHVNNDGATHRIETGGSGSATYAWLIRNGYPDGFQVLCANCNLGKQINGGICPHSAW
jgi:hypothetical protein